MQGEHNPRGRMAVATAAVAVATVAVAVVVGAQNAANAPERDRNAKGTTLPTPANAASGHTLGRGAAYHDASRAANPPDRAPTDGGDRAVGGGAAASGDVGPAGDTAFVGFVDPAVLAANQAERERLRAALPVGLELDDAVLMSGDGNALAAALVGIEVWGSKRFYYEEIAGMAEPGDPEYGTAETESRTRTRCRRLGHVALKWIDERWVFVLEPVVSEIWPFIQENVVSLRFESQRRLGRGVTVRASELTAALIREDMSMQLPVISRRDLTINDLATFTGARHQHLALAAVDANGAGGGRQVFPTRTAFDRGEYSIGSKWEIILEHAAIARDPSGALALRLRGIPLCHAVWSGGLIDLTDANTTSIDRSVIADTWTRCGVEMEDPLLEMIGAASASKRLAFDERGWREWLPRGSGWTISAEVDAEESFEVPAEWTIGEGMRQRIPCILGVGPVGGSLGSTPLSVPIALVRTSERSFRAEPASHVSFGSQHWVWLRLLVDPGWGAGERPRSTTDRWGALLEQHLSERRRETTGSAFGAARAQALTLLQSGPTTVDVIMRVIHPVDYRLTVYAETAEGWVPRTVDVSAAMLSGPYIGDLETPYEIAIQPGAPVDALPDGATGGPDTD